MFKMINRYFFLFNVFLCFITISIKSSFSNILDITTPAKQVMIYDHEANEVLFEKNADEPM